MFRKWGLMGDFEYVMVNGFLYQMVLTQIKLCSKCNVLCRDYYCYPNHNLKLDQLSFFVIIIFNCIIVGIIIIPVIIIITKYIEIIHKIIITLLLPFFMVINIANDIALITDIIISSAVMVLPC